MRIGRLTISGFRGVRDKIDFQVPPGFMIVTGPNGSGKTTICDAIEFALTGAFPAVTIPSEAGESGEAYTWFRGQEPGSRYVRMSLESASRDPLLLEVANDGPSYDVEMVSRHLCDLEGDPASNLELLSRTSIFRNEIFLEALRTTERERYAMVSAAVGSSEMDQIIQRGESVSEMVDKRLTSSRNRHEEARNRVLQLQSEVSEIRSRFQEGIDITNEISRLASMMDIEDISDRSWIENRARSSVGKLKSEIDALRQLKEDLGALTALEDQLSSTRNRLDGLGESVGATDEALAGVNKRVEEIDGLLAKEGVSIKWARDYATMLTLAEEMGLRDGRCPVCGLEQDDSHFHGALEAARSILEEGSLRRVTLEAERKDLVSRRDEVARRRVEMEGEMESLKRSVVQADAKVREIHEQLARFGLLPDSNPAAIDKAIDTRTSVRTAMIESLAALETVRYSSRLEELESSLSSAKEEATKADVQMRVAEALKSDFDLSLKQLKRGIAQVVEERLESVRPILEDIYFRLQPHPAWRSIDFSIRGDIRRFISIRVGEDLNPKFMFSSGQQQATGLAFFLAIFLSRPWSRLQTIVVDDPVQHIDDPRMLNCVETLAALRRLGYQVICTAENADVANLLARRLAIGKAPEGALVNLEYRRTSGISVRSIERVDPFPVVLGLAAA